MTSPLQAKTPHHSEWALSLLISATLGCLVVAFVLLLIFYHFLVGLLYPVVALLLMKGAHLVLTRAQPADSDPRHLMLQASIIIGGLVSVVVAYLVSGVISWQTLFVAGACMAGLAALSIALERWRRASLLKAAERALRGVDRAQKLMEYGEHVNAQEELEKALLACELAYGSYHESVATIVTRLAEVCEARDKVRAARAMYERAVHVRASVSQSTSEFVALLQRFADHLYRTGDFAKSYSVASHACVESRRVHGQSAPTAYSLLALARAQERTDKVDDAFKSSLGAIKILENDLGKNHADTLTAKGLAANQCVTLGRLAEAERIIREVLAAKQRTGVVWDAAYLNLLLDLIEVQSRLGSERDEKVLLEATEVYRTAVGPDYPRAQALCSYIAAYLSSQASPSRHGLYESLFGKEQSAVRKRLDDDETLVTEVDASGWTLLQWGVFFDQRDVVERLLSGGADTAHGGGQGYPALYIASRWRRKWMVAALDRKKADIEITCGDGSRPIHGAVRSGDPLTFDSLLALKPQLDQANDRGWTALHEAAQIGNQSFLLELISRGLDINFQGGTRRESPLHAAVLGGHRGAVEALLLNGAEANAENVDGATPIVLATELGRQDLVLLLSQHGSANKADDSPTDASGRLAALMFKGSRTPE